MPVSLAYAFGETCGTMTAPILYTDLPIHGPSTIWLTRKIKLYGWKHNHCLFNVQENYHFSVRLINIDNLKYQVPIQWFKRKTLFKKKTICTFGFKTLLIENQMFSSQVWLHIFTLSLRKKKGVRLISLSTGPGKMIHLCLHKNFTTRNTIL